VVSDVYDTSQIELGAATVSVEVFIAIAHALKVNASDLLREAEVLAQPRKPSTKIR
jgi:hypothetical protein